MRLDGGGNADKPREVDRGLTRRDALKVLGVGTLGAGLVTRVVPGLAAAASTPASAGATPVPGQVRTAVPPAVRPFDLHEVDLLERLVFRARDREVRYLLHLDPDHMLHGFRVNAGLEPKGLAYGGWASLEPWLWLHCHGHTLGHWLSAASLAVAATADPRLRERIAYVVGELGPYQDAAGT